MSGVVEIIVTGPPDVMPGLVETLVGERLIACGQLTPINSVYRWDGDIERASEVRAAMHTRQANGDAVTRRVRDLHPYEVPCILVLRVLSGDSDYLDWVDEETRPAPTAP